MSIARKFKPGWDDAFFLERTVPDREGKPRLPATVIELPKRLKFDPVRAVEAWLAIGCEVSAEHVRAHLRRLRQWQRRLTRINRA
jgi:hypothetical protein